MRWLLRVLLALTVAVLAAAGGAGVAEWRLRRSRPAVPPLLQSDRTSDAANIIAAARVLVEKNALSAQVMNALEQADRYELIAVDPRPSTKASPSQAAVLHDFPVLGSVVIHEKATQAKLTAALQQSMRDWPHLFSKCTFQPRHAIRAVKGADTIEIMICFHCGDLITYVNGKSIGFAHVNMVTPPVFTEVLTAANVPYDKDGRE